MSKMLKRLMVDEYKRAFDGSQSCVLLDTSAMNVAEIQDFRSHLRENNIGLRVVRNRLAFHAVEGSPLEPVRELFVGQTAVAYSPDDVEGITTVKTIKNYLKQNKTLPVTVKAALSEGQALEGAAAEALANVPDKNDLRAMACSAILGSARGLATSLNGLGAGLARCLQQRVEQGGE